MAARREELEYANGRVRNPRTGRLVNVRGRVGQRVVAAQGLARVGPRGAAGDYVPQGDPDIAGALRTQRYVYDGANPRHELGAIAPAIVAASRHHGALFRGVVVRFVGANGLEIWRDIRHAPDVDAVLAELAAIEYGEPMHGSGVVEEGQILDVASFMVRYVVPPRGGAGRNVTAIRETALYRVCSYKGAENDCIFNILRAIRPIGGTRNRFLRRELGLPEGPVPCTEDCMKRLADHFHVAIEVVGPGLQIQREFADSAANGNRCHAVAAPNVLVSVVPEVNEGSVQVYYEAGHCEQIRVVHPIELCPYTGDHLAEVGRRTEKQLRDRILAQGRVYYGCGKPLKTKPTRIVRRMVLVFDFETTYDLQTARLEAYAVAWHVYPVARADADFRPDDAKVALGPRCADALMDFILQSPDDVTYTLVSFNGARFDNFVLAQAAARREALSDVFYAGGMLRDVRIRRHSTIDLCKLCPMSLAAACKSFGTLPVKLAGFHHSEPQQARAEGRLEAWVAENRELVTEYVRTDVLATCSLAVKLDAVFCETVGMAPIEGKVGTIAGLAWKAFQTQTPEMPEPPADKEMDAFLRRCITGGRTQNFEAPGFTTDEPCRMVDVCSLYPTAMSGARAELMPECVGYGRYPLGQAAPTEVYVPGKLGFYHVRVVNQPIPNILPRRGSTLDWACREPFETYAASPSIELIRSLGGEVVLTPDQDGRVGYYYERDTRDLFNAFLGPIIAGKSQEDEYKERKDARYNPARREALKLVMNSLSGKWAQAQYDDAAVLAKGRVNQFAAERKMKGGIAAWYPISGEVCLLVGKKDVEYKQKTAKPVQIAALIYDYSRAFMWHVVYSRCNPIYTDTDSALVRRADYERFRLEFPQLDPHGRLKVLGDLEEELGGDSTKLIIIAPKMYYVEAAKGVKARAKGVSLDRDYLVDEVALEALKEAPLITLHECYSMDEIGDPERIWSAEALWIRERMARLREFARPFFERIRDAGEASVLTSSLRRGVGPEGFFLAQRFLVKRIKNPALAEAEAEVAVEGAE